MQTKNAPPSRADGPSENELFFAVGITGHRDLVPEECDQTETAVRKALLGLSMRFKNMPIQVVTGLAEGADTLVAHIALDMGLAVHAVLPLPADIYANDFDGAALKTFRTLLQDPRVQVSEIPLADGVTAESVSEPSVREGQYVRLMDYIQRRSNLLLALWDGDDKGLAGGTGDVVLGYLGGVEGQRPMEVPIDAADPETGADLVYWVPVSRSGSHHRTAPAAPTYLVASPTSDYYWKQAAIPAVIDARWKGLDAFAGERALGLGQDLPGYPLLPDNAPPVSMEIRGIEAEYIRIDKLARANQTNSDRMFKLFGLLAAAMGFFFLVYAKIAAVKAFLVIYILLFVVGFIGFKVSRRNQWLPKHLCYRALAETLRVQLFLAVSGVARGYGMSRILRLTNVDSFERFDWLRDAIRCCEPLVETGHAKAQDALELVRTYWVEDQANYYHRKLHAMHRRHERLERVKGLLLAGSVLGALALIFFKKALLHLDMAGYDGKAILVFLMGLLPLWVAVWELYQGKMATRELIWQYSNQERLFRAAIKPLTFAKRPQDATRIITDLADKALIENYLWSVHRYHREHEPPAAG
ncbi:hypothetical protein [Actibacterium sp.]|uniref:hypothetical protein n=1 Tax=Actibacterium sp. TaxID=1872125 RepID=UPI00356656E7